MEIKVIKEEPKILIGISWSGSFSQSYMIPSLFEDFEKRIEEISNKVKEEAIICPFHDRKTDFTYYVTHEVTHIEHIPNGMISLQLPEQKYVKAAHNGKTEDIDNTYIKIFNWMNQNHLKKDYQSLSIEKYLKKDEAINRAKDYKKFEIYVPIL
ncbi:hypothetical protein B4064_2811 [Caldibacillus thermoamylovorans]|uniref:GyrI-like domain-containing protein n=2 Tax=Bacillales TaxID=1385 RepID=UPI0005A47ABE|nr:hypothetical protein B4064_2811 [Caldibacillus thermoamylovorans]